MVDIQWCWWLKTSGSINRISPTIPHLLNSFSLGQRGHFSSNSTNYSDHVLFYHLFPELAPRERIVVLYSTKAHDRGTGSNAQSFPYLHIIFCWLIILFMSCCMYNFFCNSECGFQTSLFRVTGFPHPNTTKTIWVKYLIQSFNIIIIRTGINSIWWCKWDSLAPW